MQQTGSTPFRTPKNGLYQEAAFDRSPEDTSRFSIAPHRRSTAKRVQSRRGVANPAVSHYCRAPGSAFDQRPYVFVSIKPRGFGPRSSHFPRAGARRGRGCLAASSPEQLRGAKTPRARRRRRAGTRLPLFPHPPWTHICFIPKRCSPIAQKPVVAPRNTTRGKDSRIPTTATPKSRGGPRRRASSCPRCSTTFPDPTAKNHRLEPPSLFGSRTPSSPRPLRRGGGGHQWPLPSSSLAGVSLPAPLPRGGLGAPGHGHSHRAMALLLRRCPCSSWHPQHRL